MNKIFQIILIIFVANIYSLNLYSGRVGNVIERENRVSITPKEDVLVTLQSLINETVSFSDTTDENGFFVIRVLNDEILFTQTLNLTGYETDTTEIQIFDDNDRVWDLSIIVEPINATVAAVVIVVVLCGLCLCICAFICGMLLYPFISQDQMRKEQESDESDSHEETEEDVFEEDENAECLSEDSEKDEISQPKIEQEV